MENDDDLHFAGAVLIFILLTLIGALVGVTADRLLDTGRIRRPMHLVPVSERPVQQNTNSRTLSSPAQS